MTDEEQKAALELARGAVRRMRIEHTSFGEALKRECERRPDLAQKLQDAADEAGQRTFA